MAIERHRDDCVRLCGVVRRPWRRMLAAVEGGDQLQRQRRRRFAANQRFGAFARWVAEPDDDRVRLASPPRTRRRGGRCWCRSSRRHASGRRHGRSPASVMGRTTRQGFASRRMVRRRVCSMAASLFVPPPVLRGRPREGALVTRGVVRRPPPYPPPEYRWRGKKGTSLHRPAIQSSLPRASLRDRGRRKLGRAASARPRPRRRPGKGRSAAAICRCGPGRAGPSGRRCARRPPATATARRGCSGSRPGPRRRRCRRGSSCRSSLGHSRPTPPACRAEWWPAQPDRRRMPRRR